MFVSLLGSSGPLSKPFFPQHSLSELTTFTRASHRDLLKRWFKLALERITHIFSPRKLEDEEFKKEAIKDYVSRHGVSHLDAIRCIALPDDPEFRREYYALCQAFPEEGQSLCTHLAKWVHAQLLKLKRNCQPSSTASSPYVVRKHLLGAEALQRLQFGKDNIEDTREFFDAVTSKASTIYLLMDEKLDHHLWKWSNRIKSSKEKRSLLHTLRFYFLKVLAGAPVADPVVMRLLWSMTTGKCAKAVKRRIHIHHNGKKVTVTGHEALTSFWSDIVRRAIHIDEEDCSKSAESNCAVVKTYLQYKTHLHPQLQEAATENDFVGRAVRIISHMQSREDMEGVPDTHAFDMVSEKCRETAAADLLYSFNTSKTKFKKVINFIGRHKWSRKILLSLVRKSVHLMLPHGSNSESHKGTVTAASPRSPEEVAALALYYGFKSGSEIWALTGIKGLGELADHIIRRQVVKMWTKMHPQGHFFHGSYLSGATSFVQRSSHQDHLYRSRAVPEILSTASMIYTDSEQFGLPKLLRPELALVEKKWSSRKRRAVIGVSGAAIVFIAISGLTGGAVAGLMFPLMMLFAGLCMCLYAVVSSLKSEGLILSSGKSADSDEGADDEEE